MDVLVTVVGQRLKVPTDSKRFVRGTKNFINFVFNFDPEWNDMTLYADFRQNGRSNYIRLINGNSAYLPQEIDVGSFSLRLYGEIDNSKIALTNYEAMSIFDDSYAGGSGGSTNPSGGIEIEVATLNEVQQYLEI